MISGVTSQSIPPSYETIAIEALPTEDLRHGVRPSWPTATRDQLLAYYRNRSISYIMIQRPDVVAP
jgi:hypothetical protein